MNIRTSIYVVRPADDHDVELEVAIEADADRGKRGGWAYDECPEVRINSAKADGVDIELTDDERADAVQAVIDAAVAQDERRHEGRVDRALDAWKERT